jgi:hypothetical protein
VSRRPLVAAALGVLLVGCTGGGPSTSPADPDYVPPSPTPGPTAGVPGEHPGRTVVDSTTFKGARTGDASVTQLTFVFTCADKTCGRVLQRTDAAPGTPQSRTYSFTVIGDTWTAVHTANGTCTAPATGRSTQRITWSWTRAKNGSMEGQVDQVATGCGADGKASLRATVEPTTSGPLPYLKGQRATALKRALTSYDTALKPVYLQYPTCTAAFSRGDATEGGRCFTGVLRQWRPALVRFEASFARLRREATATGSCRRALSGVTRLQALREALARADSAFAVATAQRTDYEQALAALDAAQTVNASLQPSLLSVATRCIAPNDLQGLGTNGELAIDVDGLVLAQRS